jgi:hypothetical protein
VDSEIRIDGICYLILRTTTLIFIWNQLWQIYLLNGYRYAAKIFRAITK